MDKKAQQIFIEMNGKGRIMDGDGAGKTNWEVKEDGEDSSDSTSISEDSMNSMCSSSSDLTDEEAFSATSYLSTSSSSSHLNGPLYELSELMNNLPIKRGLSMFYQGKAQSFSSLARVQSIEDLPKKCTPHRKRMKSCKSYGVGLDSHRISKKASRGSFVSSVLSKRGSFIRGSRLSIAVHKKF